jgi:hypothetical protein
MKSAMKRITMHLNVNKDDCSLLDVKDSQNFQDKLNEGDAEAMHAQIKFAADVTLMISKRTETICRIS